MGVYLRYDINPGKPSRDKIIADLYEKIEGRHRVGLDLRVTRKPEASMSGEAEVRLKGTLEVAASGFVFHDSDKVLPIDCHPVDVVLNPNVTRVEMFFYPLAG